MPTRNTEYAIRNFDEMYYGFIGSMMTVINPNTHAMINNMAACQSFSFVCRAIHNPRKLFIPA